MDIKYIDIHSHLGFEDYGTDLKEVIARMKNSEIGTIAVGADLASSRDAVKVASENDNVWACIGQHPTHNMTETESHHGEIGPARPSGAGGFDEVEFEELIKNPKVVAIGECGLDYSQISNVEYGVLNEEKERQKVEFIKQINFSIKYNKPLMLHIRNGKIKDEAFDDAYNILNSIFKIPNSTPRGNVHFFTGKLEMAQKFIDLGFTISFVGLITYVQDFDKIIKNVPLESLQAETDAPYVAPVPHRGERNEPAYVTQVYAKIAEIRGEDPDMVRLQLVKNAKKVFKI